jgi:hypothetical protein
MCEWNTTPEWWDSWHKKNLKKKLRLFHKVVKNG